MTPTAGWLAAIVRFSLHYRCVVIALACLLVGYGLYTASRDKYDVFPEFASPQATIQIQAPGLAPEQLNEGRDLALTTDFRTVFSEVATKHLGAPLLEKVFPGFSIPASRWLGVL